MHVEEGAVGDEGIVLTDREREALAQLAESIGDPWLAGQLAGQEQPEPPRRRQIAPPARLVSALQRATAGWIGLALVLAGAALAVTTFMHSIVIASLGLVLMGVGTWRLVAEHGEAISQRLAARRTRTAPAAPTPPPPHTPPGAV